MVITGYSLDGKGLLLALVLLLVGHYWAYSRVLGRCMCAKVLQSEGGGKITSGQRRTGKANHDLREVSAKVFPPHCGSRRNCTIELPGSNGDG